MLQPAGAQKKVFPPRRNLREQKKKFFRHATTCGSTEKSFPAVLQPAGAQKKVLTGRRRAARRERKTTNM
jgi:hypothetical protein